MHKHLIKLALASLLSSSIVLAQIESTPDNVARDLAVSGGDLLLDERSFDTIGELEERGTEEDCDDEGRPATVYVTVTVDGGSGSGGAGGAAATGTPGSGGSSGAGASSYSSWQPSSSDSGACTTGCGSGSGSPSSSVTDTALGTASTPAASGSGAGAGGATGGAISSPTSTPLSTAAPSATQSGGEWDDWGEDTGSGSSSSSSGSGMPTSGAGGADDTFSAGFRTTTAGVPILVSLGVCLFTSVLAGVLVTL